MRSCKAEPGMLFGSILDQSYSFREKEFTYHKMQSFREPEAKAFSLIKKAAIEEESFNLLIRPFIKSTE